MAETSTTRQGQRRKRIEEVVTYAVGHRTRVQILIILNEGTFTPGQIAHIIGEPLNRVSNHIRELVDAGSIELAKTEPVRNTILHFYRAVEMPEYSAEDLAAMTSVQRQVIAGLVIQSAFAELMASLWAEKMNNDELVWLVWDWFNLDRQARQEVADEQKSFWERMREIEVDSINRQAETGEKSRSIIVSMFGFERARKGPNPPPPSPDGEYPPESD